MTDFYPPIFIFSGIIGAGKDTLIERFIEWLVGQNLRQPTQIATGKLARKYDPDMIASGKLFNDQTVCSWVERALNEADQNRSICINGFPRTRDQAEILPDILRSTKWNKSLVIPIHITIDPRLVHQRAADRIKKAINLGDTPRADDNPEVVKVRLQEYAEKTEPAIRCLADHFGMIQVRNDRKIRQAYQELCQMVEPLVFPRKNEAAA